MKTHLRSGVNRELELGLLTVVGRESLEEESSETRSGSSTEGVEDEESLESGTVVGQVSHSIQDGIDKFLSDSVVSSGVYVPERKRGSAKGSSEREGGREEGEGNAQLLAASSFPEIKVWGWKRDL